MSAYHGSCHCGNISFSAEWELASVMECNCSHCSRKGFLLWFVPRSSFSVEPLAMPTTSYYFNRHAIEHMFCSVCGVQCFGYGKDPHTGTEMAAVNVRCLEDADFAALPRVQVDGKSF